MSDEAYALALIIPAAIVLVVDAVRWHRDRKRHREAMRELRLKFRRPKQGSDR